MDDGDGDSKSRRGKRSTSTIGGATSNVEAEADKGICGDGCRMAGGDGSLCPEASAAEAAGGWDFVPSNHTSEPPTAAADNIETVATAMSRQSNRLWGVGLLGWGTTAGGRVMEPTASRRGCEAGATSAKGGGGAGSGACDDPSDARSSGDPLRDRWHAHCQRRFVIER